jgi:hypothetical protein
MSWSMLEPDDPPVCECKYDEGRDVIDRDDCPFHCDLPPDTPEVMTGLEETEGPRPVKPESVTLSKGVDVAA